jgi:hypothetical protein
MKGMSDMMIKILGVATVTLVCAAIGWMGGIVMTYVIVTSKPQYHFNYNLAFIVGIAAGTYGLFYSIHEI